MKRITILLALFLIARPATASAREYGDFKPGQTFTKTVVEKSSVRYRIWGKDKVSVPKGVPDYRKGGKIKFTIGKNGRLTARDGLDLKYRYENGDRNYYTRTRFPTDDEGRVNKNSKDHPKTVTLRFTRVKISWFGQETTVVTYKLR